MREKKRITKSQVDLLRKLKVIKVNDEKYVIQIKKVPDEYLEPLIEIAKDAQILFLRIEPEDIPRLVAKQITLDAEHFNSYFYCSTIAEAPIELLERYGMQSILVGAKNNANVRTMEIETYRSIYQQIKALVSDIPKEEKDVKKFRIIYERLANRLDYDYEAIKEGSAYAEENSDVCRNLENAVLRNKAVCTGFAETLRQTLSLVGIGANIIHSLESKDGNLHAYNLVRIEGKWYNADLTWDYRSIRKKIRPSFCLKSDEDFKKCDEKDKVFHIPEDITTPKCEESMEVFQDFRKQDFFLQRTIRKVIQKIRGQTEMKQTSYLPIPTQKEQFRDTIKTNVVQSKIKMQEVLGIGNYRGTKTYNSYFMDGSTRKRCG